MVRRLTIFIVGLAAFLGTGLAVFAQLQFANAAKPTREQQTVYSLDARESLLRRMQPDDQSESWCGNCDADCRKLPRYHEPQWIPTWRSGFARSVSDIRQIDLEGLKKLLERDPKDTRPLLVNFWATWCDGCREEFPDLVKIDNDYRARGLNFVAISLDEVEDIPTKVEPFLKEMKASMRVVLLNERDPETAIHLVDPAWQGDMPATFLYDKDGKVVFKHFGKIKSAELRSAIDKAVGSKQ